MTFVRGQKVLKCLSPGIDIVFLDSKFVRWEQDRGVETEAEILVNKWEI